GGTAPAIIVHANNPTQIATDFENAINQIKGQALSCEYAMAMPPSGAMLDINAVNVVFTPTSGNAMTLTYNKDCAVSTEGWHYDDANHPTKIEICATSCDAFKSNPGGKVDIVFGCQTQGGVR